METKNKILLVEDDVDSRDNISDFFSRKELVFAAAADCRKALALLAGGSFDVVIMDVSKPGLDGIECMMAMKKVRPELEVIILTSHTSLDVGITGMKKGAFDYCIKPVDFAELQEKIILAREKAANYS